MESTNRDDPRNHPALCSFYLRSPAPDGEGRWFYDRIDIGWHGNEYRQPMSTPPVIGDLVYLCETAGDWHGYFRIVDRFWQPVQFGSHTDWPAGHLYPIFGDECLLIVETVEQTAPGHSPLFVGAVERPRDASGVPVRPSALPLAAASVAAGVS